MAGLLTAGFTPQRREQHWQIPTTGARIGPSVSSTARHDIHRAVNTDLQKLTDLDNHPRQDVPGTDGWQDTPTGMAESLCDEEFDPDLYLVAEDRHTGSYHGIIRVWMKQPLPRLGFIGVRREFRRTRLTATLLTVVRERLVDKGVSHITTSTDVTHPASHVMARRHGGIQMAVSVQFVRN